MKLAVGKFNLRVERDHIVVTNDANWLRLTPSEGDKATAAISTALRMTNFKVLPPKIKCSPFEVRFSEDGTCMLTRPGNAGGCTFKFHEGDDLVQAIQMGVKNLTDALRLSGGAKAGPMVPTSPEPPIDGR